MNNDEERGSVDELGAVVGDAEVEDGEAEQKHQTLKYSLLGPSLTKAGQDSVDQSKVSGSVPV